MICCFSYIYFHTELWFVVFLIFIFTLNCDLLFFLYLFSHWIVIGCFSYIYLHTELLFSFLKFNHLFFSHNFINLFIYFYLTRKRLKMKNLFHKWVLAKLQSNTISFITNIYNSNKLKTLTYHWVIFHMLNNCFKIIQRRLFCNFNFDWSRFQSDGAAYIEAFLPSSVQLETAEIWR